MSRCSQCGAQGFSGSRTCPACGTLLPAAGAWEHPATERAGKPFRFQAVGETLGAVLFSPQRTFARFRWDGGLFAPSLYATLMGGPAAALGLVLSHLLAGGRLRELSPMGLLGVAFGAPLLYMALKAQAIHLVLVLLGAASRPPAATFRAVAYASGSAALLLFLPAAGGLLFVLSTTCLEILAVQAAHQAPLRSALLALVIPALALLAGLLAGAAVDLFWWQVH